MKKPDDAAASAAEVGLSEGMEPASVVKDEDKTAAAAAAAADVKTGTDEQAEHQTSSDSKEPKREGRRTCL